MTFLRFALTALVAGALGPLLLAAAPQPVGIATSEADFQVGAAWVRRQATLFEGDGVRSARLATRLRLRDGSRYVLGTGSVGTVQHGQVTLRSGSVDFSNAGRPARVLASDVTVSAETPGSAATVYVSGSNSVTVVARSGEVTVKTGRAADAQKVVRAGETLSLKQTAGKLEVLSPVEALAELNQAQSEQMAQLTEVANSYTCLEPGIRTLSATFAALSTQIASNQAARNAIQVKVNRGAATPSDLQQLNQLNNAVVGLQRASIALSADLGGTVQQFHHPVPPPDASGHATHGHFHPLHHGEHGHSVGPSGGHHEVPPHCSGEPETCLPQG
jgi:hypothetical protein